MLFWVIVAAILIALFVPSGMRAKSFGIFLADITFAVAFVVSVYGAYTAYMFSDPDTVQFSVMCSGIFGLISVLAFIISMRLRKSIGLRMNQSVVFQEQPQPPVVPAADKQYIQTSYSELEPPDDQDALSVVSGEQDVLESVAAVQAEPPSKSDAWKDKAGVIILAGVLILIVAIMVLPTLKTEAPYRPAPTLKIESPHTPTPTSGVCYAYTDGMTFITGSMVCVDLIVGDIERLGHYYYIISLSGEYVGAVFQDEITSRNSMISSVIEGDSIRLRGIVAQNPFNGDHVVIRVSDISVLKMKPRPTSTALPTPILNPYRECKYGTRRDGQCKLSDNEKGDGTERDIRDR